MSASCPEISGRVRLGGIKISPELVQIELVRNRSRDPGPTELLRHLAGNQVNMPFFNLVQGHHGVRAVFCVAARDFPLVQRILDQPPYSRQNISIIAPVGTLTVFPHQSRLDLLGLLLETLAKAGLPIYGVATSISGMSVNTDHALLDKAVDTLLTRFEIPSNHAPFCQELRLKQIRP